MRRRGPYAKSAARREEIVRVAIEHIARNGYNGTSLRAIAAEVGISQTALLHHFASKEGLLDSVLAEYRRAHLQSLTELMHDVSGREALIAGLARIDGSLGRISRLWLMLTAEATNAGHPAGGFVAERFVEARTLMAATLTSMQVAGEVRPELDVEHLSLCLLSLAHGLHVQGLIKPDLDIAEAFTRFLDDYVLTDAAKPSNVNSLNSGRAGRRKT